MTTILFGSGATIPFFKTPLTTSYLTEQVYKMERWDNLVTKYRGHTSNVMANAEDIVSLIRGFNYINFNHTFETYAEIIDKVASWGFDKMPGNNMMNTIFAVLVDRYKKYFGPEWRDVPFLYREIIVQSILELETNSKSADYKELCSKQRNFIEHTANYSDKTSLVSLNYDNVLFDSIEGLGFEHCFNNVPEAGNMDYFDYYQFHKSDKVVYFPHGHSRFKRSSFGTIQYYEDPKVAEEKRWEGVGDSRIGSSLTLTSSAFAYDFNSFITTGQTKDTSLNLPPYDAYYQRLSKDILESDWVYLIGYSFGDEHINRLLHSYLYSNPSGNIFIVDFIENDINLADEIVNGSGLVSRVFAVFKPSVFFPNIPDITQYQSNDIWEINNLGYGQLMNNIYLYKNGTHNFLNEFKDIPFL